MDEEINDPQNWLTKMGENIMRIFGRINSYCKNVHVQTITYKRIVDPPKKSTLVQQTHEQGLLLTIFFRSRMTHVSHSHLNNKYPWY